jgi:hypothetical protein
MDTYGLNSHIMARLTTIYSLIFLSIFLNQPKTMFPLEECFIQFFPCCPNSSMYCRNFHPLEWPPTCDSFGVVL